MRIGKYLILTLVFEEEYFFYRILDEKRNVILADCDDDGETGASSRMLHLMDVRKK